MYSIQEKYPSISSFIIPEITELLSHTASQCLLQLGEKWLSVSQLGIIPHHLWLTEKQMTYIRPHVYGHYEALPFYTESIDVILTPHLAHYEKNVQKIIYELFRVLKPNGYLFILGIYPLSCSEISPPEAKLASLRRLVSAYTISRQIKQAGGIIIKRKYYIDYPVSLGGSGNFLSQWKRRMLCLLPSAQHYYLIIARKKPQPIQIISFKNSVISFSPVKKRAYVKS